MVSILWGVCVLIILIWLLYMLGQIRDILAAINFRLAQKEMEDAFKRGNEKIQKR